jgi:S-layer protein
MALSAAQLITQIYVGYYDRAPDAAGLNYWVGRYNAGMKLADIAQSFSVQTESTNTYAYLANPNVASVSTFLTSVYANLFNRAPDSAGLTYWTNEINSGRSNVGNAILNIISGAQDTASSMDLTTITNKMTAAYNWASTMSNIAGAVYGTNEATSAKSIIASVTSDSATVTAAATATTSFFANGGGQSSTTYTLTTGIDNITVGSNAVINAPDISGSTSWTPLDTITGTGSNNTLNIASATAISAAPAGSSVSGIQTINISDGAGITVDVSSGYSGLTQLTATAAAHAISVTAASTTNVSAVNAGASGSDTIYGGNNVTATASASAVTIGGAAASHASPAGTITVTDTAIADTAINVDGGTNVTITETGAAFSTGNAINVGVNVKPTGTVTINAASGSSNSNTIGAIAVKGGTTVTVSETAGDSAATGTNVAMGGVTVTGGTSTTSVTVNQAAVATGATAVSQVSGILGVTSVTGTTGVQAVSAVTAVSAVDAVAATVGVSADGTVSITDANTSATTATAANKTGSISSVTLSNFGTSSIASAALTNLSLSGTGGTVTTYEGGSNASSNTTLTVNVNGLSGTTLVDNTAQFTTVNIVNGATKSSLTLNDTALTTVNVSGSSVSTLTFGTAPTSIVATGAAGVTATVTNSSTAFSAGSSTGVDTITISSDASTNKAITGSTSGANEIKLANTTFTSSNTGAQVTNFSILGVSAGYGTSAAGTYDATIFGSGVINQIDVYGALSQNTTVTASTGTNVTFDVSTGSYSFLLTSKDSNGANDTVTVTLKDSSDTYGGTTTGNAVTVYSLNAADLNSVGVGTVNIVSTDAQFNSGNTITTFADVGASTLNVSGSGGLTISSWAPTATSLTIGNTESNTAGVTITTLTAASNTLGNITFTGSNNTTISTLSDTAAAVTITNSGTGTDTITSWSDTSLSSLTLSGALNLNLTSGTALSALTLGANETVNMSVGSVTGGFTLSGASDNSHVLLNLAGVGSNAKTDTVTLGNGNDQVIDATSYASAAVNVTVGTGYDYIALGAATGAGNYTITATSAGKNVYDVGIDAPSYNSAANYVITGAAAGDIISFTADTASSNTALTATSLTSATSNAGAIQTLETALGTTQHKVAYGNYGGNTFIVELDASATPSASNTSVVELVGYTGSLTASTGFVTVGSTATSAPTIASTLSDGSTISLADNMNHNLTTVGVDGATITISGAGSNTVNAASTTSANTIDLSATTGSNTITGGSGADTIKTGSSTATVKPGAGADSVQIGGSGQTVVYAAASGETLAATITSGTTNVSTADQITGATNVFTTSGHTLKIDLSGDGVTYSAASITLGIANAATHLSGTAGSLAVSLGTESSGVFTDHAANGSTHTLVEFDTNGATAGGVQIIDITGVAASAAVTAGGILTITF